MAALAAENNLPIPTLALNTLQPSSSIFPSSNVAFRQNTMTAIRAPTLAPDNPWNAPRYLNEGGTASAPNQSRSPITNGLSSTFAGSGLPSGWWKRQESVEVTILGQQGFILNRYTVYEIKSEVRCCTFHIGTTVISLYHSEQIRFTAGTPNSYSCGIAWCGDILSVSCLNSHPSGYSVSLGTTFFTYSYMNDHTADAAFLEQRR